MKVCFIAEGSYPYVVGGVSSWMHSMINIFPEIEFNLVAIVADRSFRGKFIYDLPSNLTSVAEVYLQDLDWYGSGGKNKIHRVPMKEAEYIALQSLFSDQETEWAGIFEFFKQYQFSINSLLMSHEFLNMVKEYVQTRQMNVNFSDFLWTIRSVCLPLYMVLKFIPPQAQIYHCVATGYAGIIGSMAKHIYPASSLLISEHGIYTREREEEIIKAKWVQGVYKDIWIEQFRKMSLCAYNYADSVTSLFKWAQDMQIELGCPKNKTNIIPNGIDPKIFENIPQKNPSDAYINVGALVRISPIKDIKTMINAFFFAQKEMPNLKLWIMGPDDEDPVYAQECYDLVAALQAENIVFTGRIKATDYMGKMDFTILTSISEGQPLTILESFAAKKPCIATNVGNCMGLIYGELDDFGPAGLVVPVLNIQEITQAILKLAKDQDLRRKMGWRGYQRLLAKYTWQELTENYQVIYKRLHGLSEDRKPEKINEAPKNWFNLGGNGS